MKYIGVLFLLLFSQCVFAQEDSLENSFTFSIKEGDDQWRKLANTHERIAALQIPITQLKGLKTEQLLDICLDYPFLTSIAFCNDYQKSIEIIVSQFNGLQELVSRKDIIPVLLKKERNMIVEYERYASRSLSEKGKFAFQWLFIDLLFIQKEIKALITEKDIMEFNVIFAENHSFRKKNPEIFTGMDSISESLLCKNGILVGNNTRFYTPEYESLTIYTPKGSIVPGAVKLSNEDARSQGQVIDLTILV